MSQEQSLPHPEQVLATAVVMLIQDGRDDLAKLLIDCALEIHEERTNSVFGQSTWRHTVLTLRGPHWAIKPLLEEYEEYSAADATGPLTELLMKTFSRILPRGHEVSYIVPRVELVQAEANWRESLYEAAKGEASNQAAGAQNVYLWESHRFRSESERRIAVALEKAGVLFLPNCKARLGVRGKRENREPDFLICHNGRWGILEVDGEPYHPPSRTSQDHDRDRLFKLHNIKVIEHFDAKDCYHRPDWVVTEFLQILAKP